MTRDQIALALQQQQQRQQQQMPGRPLGSPFAPAPVPQQQPLIAGTPNAPIAAPIPQYGFQTGYNAAARPQVAGESDTDVAMKKLKELLFGTKDWGERRAMTMTPEQRQYAIGAIAIVCVVLIIAIVWVGSEAIR